MASFIFFPVSWIYSVLLKRIFLYGGNFHYFSILDNHTRNLQPRKQISNEIRMKIKKQQDIGNERNSILYNGYFFAGGSFVI